MKKTKVVFVLDIQQPAGKTFEFLTFWHVAVLISTEIRESITQPDPQDA